MNPMIVAGAIGAGGDLLSGALSAHENRRAAERQMKFQERMANTQYQRSAADLQAAGLNRILALGSPAAAPSGASYTADYGRAGTSAINAASARSVMEVNRAQEKLLGSQELQAKSQTALNDVNSAKAQAETIKALTEVENLATQRGQMLSQTHLNDANSRLANAEAAKAEVLKGVYKALGPYAERFFSDAPGFLSRTGSSAKDVLLSVGENIVLGPKLLLDSLSSSAKDAKDKAVKFLDALRRRGATSGDW